ncbi:MAG: RNA polymerase sigma-70 factor [Tannerella sp.]|nr:RNA polymerase sigma-70 factor [Tannerella sp.]
MKKKDHHYAAALERLFTRFYKPLRAYAFRYVNDAAISEDVVQDMFLELWVRREDIRFADADAVKSYLFKSVHNHAINLLKQDRLHDHCPLDDIDIDENSLLESYVSSRVLDQEQSLLLKELDAEIAGFIETLPPQCRKIFLLSRAGGLKNREIAEQLHISIKAVEKQIGKALSGLRQRLRSKDLM